MFTLVHLHLLLNHLPIIVSAIGLVLLAIGTARGNDTLVRTALAFLVAAAVTALPTYLTGEPAAQAVERLPGVVESLIKEHEEVALIASVVVGALGLYSLWALWSHRRSVVLPRAVARIALVGALGGSGLMAWTGLLGGQIRHTEVRADAGANGVAGGDAAARAGVAP